MSLQKATDIVFGNKYHIIIPAHSNLSAFKNAKASLYFEEITNFNADTSTVT